MPLRSPRLPHAEARFGPLGTPSGALIEPLAELIAQSGLAVFQEDDVAGADEVCESVPSDPVVCFSAFSFALELDAVPFVSVLGMRGKLCHANSS